MSSIPLEYTKHLKGVGEYNPQRWIKTTRYAVGPAFSGKTATFLRQPRTAYIDLQGGAKFVPPADGTMVFPVACWVDIEALEKQLLADAKAPAFDAVVIDPILRARSWYEDHLEHTYHKVFALMDPKDPRQLKKRESYKLAMGYKYENLVNQGIMGLLNRLKDAGYGWTVIGHLKINKKQTPDGQPTPTLQFEEEVSTSQALHEALCREADFYFEFDEIEHNNFSEQSGSSKFKLEVVERLKVRAKFPDRKSSLSRRDAGVRIPLPESIWLPRGGAWEALERTYNEAVEKEKAFWKINEGEKKMGT